VPCADHSQRSHERSQPDRLATSETEGSRWPTHGRRCGGTKTSSGGWRGSASRMAHARRSSEPTGATPTGIPLNRPLLLAGLGLQLAHQPHRLVLLSLRIPTRRRPPRPHLLRHDSILVPKVRSLQRSQGGSLHSQPRRCRQSG
jgi:hypothetical protein